MTLREAQDLCEELKLLFLDWNAVIQTIEEMEDELQLHRNRKRRIWSSLKPKLDRLTNAIEKGLDP